MSINATYDEQELIASFQQGEHQALQQLYALYLRALCFFTEQLVADTMAAEDIASECFIKAFHKRADFPSLGQLKSFLFVSARNAALNYIKAQKLHEDIHQSIGLAADPFAMDAEEAYIRTEAMQTIAREIEQLPLLCRQVVHLAIVEGKRAPEIAEELNIAYQTVLNQKAKGIALLRVALLKKELSLPVLLAAWFLIS